MNKPIRMDAEYESIRTIFNSRNTSAGQLPGKTVRFIPETSRTDAVIALDRRIEKIQKYAPLFMISAIILVSFFAGTCV